MGDWGLNVEGYTPLPNQGTPGDWQVVTPGYFGAIGTRIVVTALVFLVLGGVLARPRPRLALMRPGEFGFHLLARLALDCLMLGGVPLGFPVFHGFPFRYPKCSTHTAMLASAASDRIP